MYFFPLSKTCFDINLPPDDVKKASLPSCSFDEKSVFEKRTVVANKLSWQDFRYQFQSKNLESCLMKGNFA